MNANDLRPDHAPLKEQYRESPEAALVTSRAQDRKRSNAFAFFRIKGAMVNILRANTIRRLLELPLAAPC